MACDFRTRRTHGPLCDLHLENFPDHASALWFTPCRRRLTCRKASESLSGGWAGLPPPSPASLLFWETIVGVPTSPKLPPLNEAGGRGAASWLNKAETPVCQKQADGDRPICAARFSEPAEDSFGPDSPQSLAILLLSISLLRGFLYPRMNVPCQNQPGAFKRPERQLYFRGYLPCLPYSSCPFMWAGRTPRKKSKTIFSVPWTSVIKSLPSMRGLWLFCSCETCAELHSSWKHILSTNLPGVVLRLGGETAGKKASSKLVDECSKKQLPCIAKIMSHLLRWMVFPFLFWCFIYNRVSFSLTYGKVHTDHRRGPNCLV